MRFKHPTPVTDKLYEDANDDPNRDPDIREARARIQCEKFERALAELGEQHTKLKEAAQGFLQLMDIQEESDSGRVFHPNTITSCRAHDLNQIRLFLDQMKLLINPEGGNDGTDA
jgi:hypothetical protein